MLKDLDNWTAHRNSTESAQSLQTAAYLAAGFGKRCILADWHGSSVLDERSWLNAFANSLPETPTCCMTVAVYSAYLEVERHFVSDFYRFLYLESTRLVDDSGLGFPRGQLDLNGPLPSLRFADAEGT